MTSRPLNLKSPSVSVSATKPQRHAKPWDGLSRIPCVFVQRVEAAKQRVLKARDLKNEVEERKDGVKDELRRANEGFLKVV